jgi:RNA-directed DNA polymerase
MKQLAQRMNLWHETKSVPISRQMVWEAYKKVRANQGSAGIDQISMEEYEASRSKHLYKLWNRMASGSYLPPRSKKLKYQRRMAKSANWVFLPSATG